VRHVALEEPLEIVIDGQSRHGVVMKPGKRFEVYVGQVDAFMALQEQYN
jgi:formate dehydrogenase assembly factor FdhD